MADELKLPELDRLLRQELSVEPSADFLPRVRARVGRERDRTPARPLGLAEWMRLPRWQLAAGFAMLAVAVSSILLLRTPGPPPQPAPTADVARTTPMPGEPADPSVQPNSVAPLRAVPAERPGHSAAVRVPPAPGRPILRAPEVIVDAGQRAAISRVLEMVNAGQLTEASFVASRPVDMPVITDVTTTPIAVDELAVSPVTVGGVLQKGTERN